MKKKTQTEKYDAWAVICSKGIGIRAFTIKRNAELYKEFLSTEYLHNHKIVKCKIVI